jgi:hypothetical protein
LEKFLFVSFILFSFSFHFFLFLSHSISFFFELFSFSLVWCCVQHSGPSLPCGIWPSVLRSGPIGPRVRHPLRPVASTIYSHRVVPLGSWVGARQTSKGWSPCGVISKQASKQQSSKHSGSQVSIQACNQAGIQASSHCRYAMNECL